ncbi:MAG: cyclic nucleotide-binding domain-containing protein [Acidimicrobiia bacterium]
MSELVATLSDHDFFRGMSEAHLAKLAGVATEIEVEGDKVLFGEGGTADAAYAIVSGSIALELSVATRQLIVQTLHGGEMLGWSWLYPPYRWSFSAVANDPVHLIRFEAEQLRDMFDNDCALGYEVMKRFAGVITSRLAATRLQLVDFYGNAN